MKRKVDDLAELERGLAIDIAREQHGASKARVTRRGVVEVWVRGSWAWRPVGTVEQVLREAAMLADGCAVRIRR